MAKISIIIPVYNTEKYLRACLESVVQQSFSDIEILCVNDGSTDGSLAILKEFSNQDPRIKLISQTNKGLSITRNTGLLAATGTYVYFLDSDDFLTSDALKTVYMLAERDNLDMLTFDSKVVFEPEEEDKEKHQWRINQTSRSKEYNSVTSGRELFSQMKANNDYCAMVWLYFYSRNFLFVNDLKFTENITFEDNEFTFKAILLAKRTSHLKSPLHRYRVRQEAITTIPRKVSDANGLMISYAKMVTFALQNPPQSQEEEQTYIQELQRIRNLTRLLYVEARRNNKGIAFNGLEQYVFATLNHWQNGYKKGFKNGEESVSKSFSYKTGLFFTAIPRYLINFVAKWFNIKDPQHNRI